MTLPTRVEKNIATTLAKRVPFLRTVVCSYFLLTTIVPLLLVSNAPGWEPMLQVAAQASPAQVEITSWHDCSETLPNTNIAAQIPLQCTNAKTFSRMRLQGTVQFGSGNNSFFNGAVLNGEWQCVPPDRNVVFQALAPNGKCTALPDNTRVQVTLGRPRYGYRLTEVNKVPYGYLLVNYTANMSQTNESDTSYYLSMPQLLDNSSTWSVNDTCGGLNNVQMVTSQGCSSILPPYVTQAYMETCGACGDNPYLPLMRKALVGEAGNVAQLNANSCTNAMMCYPCNATNSTELTERVVYQTFAFGGPCTVYRIDPSPELYVDAFINISVANDTLYNSVYVAAMYDQGQAQIGMSLRAPTLRASVNIEADENQVGVMQLNGYIIICPDSTAVNSTRPPAVLGNFNWLYNTSGYVPSFRWNQLVQPPALRQGVGRERMNGAFIYLTPSQYADRFQPSVSPPNQCAMTNIMDDSALVSTQILYSDADAVSAACIAPPYNFTDPSNATYYGQVHPSEGACVPGMDPRYGVEPGKRFARNQTVCQMIQQMDAFAVDWAAATPTMRASMGPPPFLPLNYNMEHPPYYLTQLSQQASQQQQTQLLLMYTPPNVGRGILASYDLTVDVSTDLVPYLTQDTNFVVLNSGGPTLPFNGNRNSGTICRFWMPDDLGYYAFEVCQMGLVKQVTFTATVGQCDPEIRFLYEFKNSSKRGQSWTVAEDQLSATYSELLLKKDNSSSTAGPYACVQSSIVLFNLTVDGYEQLGNTNGALFDSCTLTLNMTVWMHDGNKTTMTQSYLQGCAANNARRSSPWSNLMPEDDLRSWQFWAGLILMVIIILITIVFVTVAIVLTIQKVKGTKKTRYTSVNGSEMNSVDMRLAQQMQNF